MPLFSLCIPASVFAVLVDQSIYQVSSTANTVIQDTKKTKGLCYLTWFFFYFKLLIRITESKVKEQVKRRTISGRGLTPQRTDPEAIM